MTRALIVGITGQDGSYLAELLLSKGYEVWGTKRRASSYNTARVDHLYHEIEGNIRFADLTDAASLEEVVRESQPDEIYNLAAQSHVQVSFEQPAYTTDTISMGTLRLLEAFRRHAPEARFYQASSSEMFGDAAAPQDEHTPFHPLSPYACAKVHAHMLAKHYREAYGLWVACGILFNHESERRGETFVTRKITRAAGRIACGLQDKLVLGNVTSIRDWGHAEDYVRAMWMMLQYPDPEDFVIGRGQACSIETFLFMVFEKLGLKVADHVELGNAEYTRPADPPVLRADPAKARRMLKWVPEIGFDEIVYRMTEHDLALAKREMPE